MFSLVKCNCASCFDEHDCVYCIHCAKAKTFYCKECILEYNKFHGSVGVCPTCKAHYGKQNCYYIYGTDIVPVLNDQIDKYRERIKSSSELTLMNLYDQLKRDKELNISSSRSLLLQLYLNRLYKDQHPAETNIQTWFRGIYECKPLMDMFNSLSRDFSAFIAGNPDRILDHAICKINDKFNHIDWVDEDNGKEYNYSSYIYYRRVDNSDQSVLRSYVYRDLHNRPRSVYITETPAGLSDEDKGFALAGICAEKELIHDRKCITPLPTIDDLPDILKGCYQLEGCELVATLPVNEQEVKMARYSLEYSVFILKAEVIPIKLLPTIADFGESLKTSDFNTEMHYYEELTDCLKEHINNVISELSSNNEPVDAEHYCLLHSVLAVNNYVKRVLSNDTHDTVKARRIVDMLIDSVKGEVFDIPTFMAQLNLYYMISPPSRWEAELKPVIDEIIRKTLKDPAQAPTFEREIRPLLTCVETEKDDNEVTQKYVQLPETLDVSLKNILAKSDSTYKLSFVRCVCGGSVIAKDVNGKPPVYECTRCHKQLESLPEQETDPETLKLLESISKRCPVCGTYIQKAEGCNHMFCTNCKNGFNWNDLSKLDDRDNTNPHFREHRHGNSSNLRTLLDDYDRPARKEHEPIEWLGHELFIDMNNAEKNLKEHRESIEKCYTEFLNDDRFALKFVNELNINKMRIAFIQNTFDKMMAKAFENIQRNQREHGNVYTIRKDHKRLVTNMSKEYADGIKMIGAILDALNLSIDCSVNMAINLSHGIEEESYDIPQEIEAEAKSMEQEILKQIAERAQSMEPKEDAMVIGNHRITIRRG